jgi:hypothetical protein
MLVHNLNMDQFRSELGETIQWVIPTAAAGYEIERAPLLQSQSIRLRLPQRKCTQMHTVAKSPLEPSFSHYSHLGDLNKWFASRTPNAAGGVLYYWSFGSVLNPCPAWLGGSKGAQ